MTIAGYSQQQMNKILWKEAHFGFLYGFTEVWKSTYASFKALYYWLLY